MHNNQHTEITERETPVGTVTSYILGFALSIILTLAAFSLVYLHTLPGFDPFSNAVLYGFLIVCAVIQLLVQLFFFLHIGKESKPQWNLVALLFALIVVLVLVGGTLWIMQNLEHGNPHEPFENGVVTPQTEG